jgi:Na+-driven multidrug efflux pump
MTRTLVANSSFGATDTDNHALISWVLAGAAALLAIAIGVALVWPADLTIADAVRGLVQAAEATRANPGDVGRAMSEAETEALRQATMLTAWWAFAMMLLGAVGAIRFRT